MIENEYFEQPLVYALKHKNDSERLLSQSGGAFAVISEGILKQNGVIYGCVFNEKFQAIHARAENTEERNRMRYSKYVQSRIGEAYKNVLSDLEKGYTVLFTGTSCQVTGMIRYAEVFHEKIKGILYTMDLVCHGVPSPLVWRDYLSWESRKKKSGIKSVICRNKKEFGWQSHVTTIEFNNGEKTESRVFQTIFYSHHALRPSCYKCPYKDIHHSSDITIADYWGIEKKHPEFRDEKGVSLVLINSAKGKELFDQCAKAANIIQTSVEECTQTTFVAPYDSPADRGQFWQDYKTMPFSGIARKYGKDGFVWRCRWHLKIFLHRKGIVKN